LVHKAHELATKRVRANKAFLILFDSLRLNVMKIRKDVIDNHNMLRLDTAGHEVQASGHNPGSLGNNPAKSGEK
jgi:hypothetical protein